MTPETLDSVLLKPCSLTKWEVRLDDCEVLFVIVCKATWPNNCHLRLRRRNITGRKKCHECSMNCHVSPGWDGVGERLHEKAHLRWALKVGIHEVVMERGQLGHSHNEGKAHAK